VKLIFTSSNNTRLPKERVIFLAPIIAYFFEVQRYGFARRVRV